MVCNYINPSHNLKAAGSNPAPATNNFRGLVDMLSLFYF